MALIPMSRLPIKESPFEQHYELEREVGSGRYGVVHCVRDRSTGQRFAAKFIEKARRPRERIQCEADILQAVRGHECVVELVDVFESEHEVVLVQEYVAEGDMVDHLNNRELLAEPEVAQFVFQLLRALQHLHRRHIAHLDIRPENIMLRERGKPLIKLIDFGLSRELPPGSSVRGVIGSLEYMAPEIISCEPLQLATDMWALGVLTYLLLSGLSPFLGESEAHTLANIKDVNFHFPEQIFGKMTALAKDFIGTLLVRDVTKRATAEDCVRHEWITLHVQAQQSIQQLPPILPDDPHNRQQSQRRPKRRWKWIFSAFRCFGLFARSAELTPHSKELEEEGRGMAQNTAAQLPP